MTTRATAKYGIKADDDASRVLKQIKGNISGVEKAFKQVQVAAAVAVGATGLGATFKAIVLDTADALDQVAKQATALGTSVERLEALNFAAELGGASAEGMAKAYKNASKVLVDAANGMGEGKDALDAMGIEARDASGRIKSVEQVMLEFAEKLPRLASETEKVAAAQRVFGRSGVELLPMLRQGSEAMREQLAEGAALTVRTTEMAAKAEAFKDAQLRMNKAMEGAKDILSVAVLPAFEKFYNFLSRTVLTAVTGLDHEFRTMMGEVALLDDASFGDTAAQKLAELKRAMDEAARASEELKQSQIDKESVGTLALMPQALTSVSTEAARAAEKFEEAKREYEAFQKLISERTEEQERSNEADGEAAILRQQEIDALSRKLELQDQENAGTADAIRETMALAGAIADLKEIRDQENAAAQLAAELAEEYAPTMPEFDLGDLPEPPDPSKFILEWEKASSRVAASISADMGDAIATVIQGGDTSAIRFEDMWKRAIAAVASDLTNKLFLKLIGDRILPGIGSVLDGLFNQTAAPAGAAAIAGGPTVIEYNAYSLVPASTADFVRAARTVRDSFQEQDRFSVVRGS